MNPFNHFWYLINQLGWKDRYYELLNPHGVTSIKHLSPQKMEEVVDSLQSEWNTRSKRPRSTVIHYLCIMPNYNYKTLSNEPNYEKIDEWVNSKFGKELNKLTLKELNSCVSAVKGWYAKELKKTTA